MHSNNKLIIVLPITGEPFVSEKCYRHNSNDLMIAIQKTIGGYFNRIDNKQFHIDPDGYESGFQNSKWLFVINLLKNLRKNQYKIYVNECKIESLENPNILLQYSTEGYCCCLYGVGALVLNSSAYYDFLVSANNTQSPLTCLDMKEIESFIDETDPYADEKAYDEYKNK